MNPNEPTLSDRIRFVLAGRDYEEARTAPQLARATNQELLKVREHLVAVKSMIRTSIEGVMVGFDHLNRLCAWRSAPLPGFIIQIGGDDAREVYDIDEHIRRALRARPEVTYQNTLSLSAYGVNASIPASVNVSSLLIERRLREAIETERKIKSVIADYDTHGRLIAQLLPELPPPGHEYSCCGKVGRISAHRSWCKVNKRS